MDWTSNPTLIVVVILGALLLLLLGAYALSASRNRGRSAPAMDKAPAAWISALKEGEEMASPAAEAIEALAQAKLAKHTDLAGIHLDFGTADSGDLEIWIGDDRYDAVDDIPDERIRTAIAEAVDEFNVGQARTDAG